MTSSNACCSSSKSPRAMSPNWPKSPGSPTCSLHIPSGQLGHSAGLVQRDGHSPAGLVEESHTLQSPALAVVGIQIPHGNAIVVDAHGRNVGTCFIPPVHHSW